jgi:DNA-binding CsgD family transcriptional regulator
VNVIGPSRLTPRELEVAAALAAGESRAQIAARLHISPHTVESHSRAILARTHARTRAQAIAELVRSGAIE